MSAFHLLSASRLPHASLRKCRVFKLFYMHMHLPLPSSHSQALLSLFFYQPPPSKSVYVLVSNIFVCLLHILWHCDKLHFDGLVQLRRSMYDDGIVGKKRTD